jgi:hypothetical protein
MHGNIKIVVIYIIHCTPHLYPAKIKRLDLTVMFYTLSMQLPLWPFFWLYCFVSSLFPVDEDVNAQTRSKFIYGVDKLRMINSYLTSVIDPTQWVGARLTGEMDIYKTRQEEEGKEGNAILEGRRDSRQHSNSTIRYSPNQINRQASIKPSPSILPLDLDGSIDNPPFPTSSNPRICTLNRVG